MQFEPLTAISSVDGRYRTVTEPLAEYFSEYALIRARIKVEFEYLIALSEAGLVRQFTDEEKKWLRNEASFTVEHAQMVKNIEKEGLDGIPATNHDVKAVEYFIKKQLAATSLTDVAEWVHFALTSEDSDNVAHALLLRGAIEEALSPVSCEIGQALDALILEHAETPMLARTHGQPASPTTFGKEMRIFVERFRRQAGQIADRAVLVKFSGATGNFNAHMVAAPEVDWRSFSRAFIERFNKKEGIRLELNGYTNQIEPHDTYAEMFDNMRRLNTVLIALSQDIWRYISDGWITQRQKEGEVGSSTMPHKVNPIDFENAEGNLGVANALFNHYSNKLPISRLQRDLSDSTVKRTFGVAFAHTLIGFKSILRGLEKISVNKDAMLLALQRHPEVLAEAIQTVLRKEGVEVPYEKLKALTRGREVTLQDFAAFIEGLQISDEVKTRLKSLRPENYLGLAAEIARAK
ncbi:MAG: Adenylosuccinate lyase [Parcubacteria group bacterium GW2011_GWA2_51_10]|nr:MAG: Adenylosuccinate lyase [Parcubacteria group bacterium GW2011_GWA2_51_10]